MVNLPIWTIYQNTNILRKSMGDRNKIQYISMSASYPARRWLSEDKPGTGFRVKSNSIGIHIYPETFTESEMDQFVQWCSH